MKKFISLLFMATAICSAAFAQNEKIEKTIDKTLTKMTLEEKIGQMTELAIDVLGHWQNGEFILDEDKMENVFNKYKVGSILNAPGVALSTGAWNKIITAINEYSINACGIPTVYGLDQNHGGTYTLGATMFPQNINMAASFNTDLVTKGTSITAYETRAANCPWTYSPTVDLSRDPRWPRVWENYGEDCLVNSRMGVAAVRGFQGNDPYNIDPFHIGTSVKHFMGYSVPRTGKDRTPAYIPEFEIREKFFAPFKACVEAGATSVMVNSASVNGIPMHVNKKFLTDWLKRETGWDGVVLTDWADINNLWQRELVAENKKDAICMAINAGIDMVMEPYGVDFCDLLKELVLEGRVSMDRINDATRRILRMKHKLGLFKTPDTRQKDYPLYGCKEHEKAAEDAAVETMVLLKNNNNILPIAHGKRIFVCGPNANSMRTLNGGWTYTWQGKDVDKYASEHNTIIEALREKFGRDNVMYRPGVTYNDNGNYWEENEPEIEKAVELAAYADIIIACVGENSYTETPGNLDDLALSENQRNLVKELSKLGKPIVLILNEGRPRLINDIEPLATAVVDILLPGNHGADALARLLAGEDNFSGRMPYTYPRHSASLTTYDYRVSEQTGTMEGAYDYNAQVAVQWPFGYGLSYTTFRYSNMKVDKTEFSRGDDITVSIDVTNTGNREGKESVLLFSRDMVASIVPEVRRLRDFTKISLKPGEKKTVTFTLPSSALAFVNTEDIWTLEPGRFMLQIGDQTQFIECVK